MAIFNEFRGQRWDHLSVFCFMTQETLPFERELLNSETSPLAVGIQSERFFISIHFMISRNFFALWIVTDVNRNHQECFSAKVMLPREFLCPPTEININV